MSFGCPVLVGKHQLTPGFAHVPFDVESQHAAEKVIADRFPDHAILGEESEEHREAKGYQWIIDPIDGTVNFAHGMHYWCSSVAVRYDDRILAGCIYAPEFKACYTAHIEAPALKNGQPIHVSKTDKLNESIFFTGLTPNMQTPGHPDIEMFKNLSYNTQKLRINGSAALDICHLAEGVADGYYEGKLHIWDLAAAALIAERAGATVDLFPFPNSHVALGILATNGLVHKDCVELYNEFIRK